jgi:uncharacterized protein YciI
VLAGDYLRFAVWPTAPLAEMRRRRAEIAQRWREHLERADPAEFARTVHFTNSAGRACADPVEAIVRHVVSHGTHHRGQIASLLRAAGHVPETLDYIVWRRAQEAAASHADAGAAGGAPTLRHFVIESTYLAPLERIDTHLEAHRAHLQTGFDAGMLLASGPQSPRTGGVILARAADRAKIDDFLGRDPFVRHGLTRYRVLEFEPVKHAPAFASWAVGE